MSDSKQVKIGVDASEYETNLQRIKSSAEDLAREMISSARAYSMSSKEVLSDIEDQIRAIEKRNKLDSDFRRESLKESRDSGQIGEKDYKRQLRETGVDSRTDTIQTQLLRDIIQTIKTTAKEEVRADKEKIERKLADDKNVGRLRPEGDEKEILKRTIQRGLIPEIGKPEEDVREKGLRFQNIVESVRAGVSAVIQSENKYESVLNVAGLAAKSAAGSSIPLVASAGVVSEAAVEGELKSLGAYTTYEDAYRRNYALSGKNSFGFGGDMTSYGYNLLEVQQEKERMSRSMGTSLMGNDSATKESLMMQRGLLLDSGSIGTTEKLLRGNEKGLSSKDVVQNVIRSMQVTGAISDNDTSMLPEYFQELLGVSQQSLMRLGSIDMGTNVRVAGAISGLSVSLTNHPALMSQVRAGLEGGLSEGGSPQMQALKYSLLSQEGIASIADMNRVMEAPFSKFGIENAPEYTANMVNFARQISGGNKDRERLQLKGFFPSLSQAIIDDNILNMDTDAFKKAIKTDPKKALSDLGISDVNIEEKAKIGTGKVKSSASEFENFFIEEGKKVIERIDALKVTTDKFGETMEQDRKEKQKMVDALTKTIEESTNTFEKSAASVTRAIVRLPLNQL